MARCSVEPIRFLRRPLLGNHRGHATANFGQGADRLVEEVRCVYVEADERVLAVAEESLFEPLERGALQCLPRADARVCDALEANDEPSL